MLILILVTNFAHAKEQYGTRKRYNQQWTNPSRDDENSPGKSRSSQYGEERLQGRWTREHTQAGYPSGKGFTPATTRGEVMKKLKLKNYYNPESGAMLSDDKRYRWKLWRFWGEEQKHIAFIGLNPSTADEKDDDPTIRRCIGFAKKWGYSGIFMLNLFGLRSTDPKSIYQSIEPIGQYNTGSIITVIASNSVIEVVICWGNHGKHLNQGRSMINLLHQRCPNKIKHFGFTKTGEPKHPLYLPSNLPLLKLSHSSKKLGLPVPEK